MGKSEQQIQNEVYSNEITILDKYTCLNLGATTVSNLMRTKTIAETNVSDAVGRKKPDVLILNKNKQVVVYIEQKAPKAFKTDNDIQKAIDQEIDVAKALNSLIYVVSDGTKFIWINPKTGNKILDEYGVPVNAKITPKKKEQNLIVGRLINSIQQSITKENDQIISKERLDPTDLAVSINKLMLNLTFASPKESLYTFVEIFVFKFLSDIGILTGKDSFEHVVEAYKKGTESDAEILYNYMHTPRKAMKRIFKPGKDGTSIINGEIFHVEIVDNDDKDDSEGFETKYESADNTDFIFRKVIEEFDRYEKKNGKFQNISNEFKSKLFETFMKNGKDTANMGQFFTPLKVVDSMVEMVDINPGDSICDPTCGVGKFLLGAVGERIPELYKYEDRTLHKGVELVGYDKTMSNKDDLTIILAKANALLYFSDLFKEHSGDSKAVKCLAKEILNDTFYSYSDMLGTLGNLSENKERFDVILANPPYYSNGMLSQEAKYTGEYTLGGHGLEGLFLEWIVKALKPGGEANVVLPDGIFSNYANKGIKEYIREQCFIEGIISLPCGAFFNTPKKTYILKIKKKTAYEMTNNIHQTRPVFGCIASTIGETMNKRRDDSDENDLKDAVTMFNMYRHGFNNKEELSPMVEKIITEDKRAKLIPISDFSKDDSWILENWWTDKELKKIGANDNKVELGLGELKDLLLEIADDIQNTMDGEF